MAKRSLTQDYDAHVPFTFIAVPESPLIANRIARLRRFGAIAFAQSWLAIFLFRLKQQLKSAGVPLLPGACDMLSRALFRVQVGERVRIGPGLMIPHGNVVIDGDTSIGRDCQINPWVTIGLSNSKKIGFSARGPSIGDSVRIGTGAKVLGPITVGDYALIGANAVVIDDVPANTTVVGAPARPVRTQTDHLEIAVDDGDERLAAQMRAAIVDYRLHRQSLHATALALVEAFERGSGDLWYTARQLEEHLVFLEAAGAAGGDSTPQVRESLEIVDAALRRVLDGTEVFTTENVEATEDY